MNTADSATASAVMWAAPDADVWELESAHGNSISPVTGRRELEDAFAEGFRLSLATLGVPLSHLELRHVNGWPYVSVFLHDVPRKAGKPPPDIVLKAISRLHPGFRKRTKVARAAIAEQRPQHFATDWFAERTRWIDRILKLQTVDLTQLDDAALGAHLRRVASMQSEAMQRHFELIAGCIPVGAWLHQSGEWGLDPADARRAVMHGTPVHREAGERLRRVATALGDARPADFDEIRAHSAEAGVALDDYLTHHGWWATGDCLNAHMVLSFPRSVAATIAAVRNQSPTTSDPAELLAQLRKRVPAEAHATFDRLAADAHRSYTMLDDNSGILGSWAVGVAGHAVRVSAERLSGTGRVLDADHVWGLDLDDISELLENRSSLSPEDAAGRHETWRAQATLTPPPHLNGSPGAPPDPGLFPQPVADLVTFLTAFLDDKFNYSGETVGIGTESVRGRAVVVSDASDAINRIEPGDILVTSATTPAYNSILPIVGGIIVTDGGASCHAAVMARELQLPGLVGYADALTTIPDGAVIDLDPVRRTVEFVDAGA